MLSSELMNRNSSDADQSTRRMFEIQQKDKKSKSWFRSRNSIYLGIVAIFEAVVVIALQAVIFAQFQLHQAETQHTTQGTGIPVYLMIFIFSQVFQVALAWDAVRAQNTIQVIALLLFNLCCFIYSIFQFKQMSNVVKQPSLSLLITRLLIVNAVVTGICELIYLYLGARLYQEFGWKIYRAIGADPEIRNMYRWYQILLSLLKLDMFFFLAYSIQYLVLVLQMTDYEFALTIVALPVTCLFLILIVYAVRHESRYLVYLFFLGLAAGCAYFSFKIFRMCDPSQQQKFMYVREFLIFFASVSLTLVVLTIVNTAICLFNFDKGLKPHLLRNQTKSTESTNQGDRTLSLD
ncbi:uncharacterized protein BX664DRAFT_377361 [Halteromyces radiatus]|uniref:uncharacterized protein n=1 Tax=Halteromyces radiatus TaxID=101107 RepID=UPI00221EFE27|nr:uncharacterized protein BX664DRAFT_377361 [Halteromyces radiatus]KAI8099479.1 hypothetical protein BX664DRAFT_377361 [Halteromyces radiatus]